MSAQSRRRMDSYVRATVRTPFSIETFLKNVSRELDRPVHRLSGLPAGSRLSGVALVELTGGGGAAFVSGPDESPEDHQLYVLAHEVWHLIKGHRCTKHREDLSLGARLAGVFRELECEIFAWKVGLAATRSQRPVGRLPAPTHLLTSAFDSRPR